MKKMVWKKILALFKRSAEKQVVDLFEKHMGQIVLEKAQLIECGKALLSEDYKQVKAKEEAISDIEHNADNIRREIIQHLYKGAFMPVMRTHLYDFSDKLDDIADVIQDAADKFGYLEGKKIPEKVKGIYRKMFSEIDTSVDLMEKIIKELFMGKNDIIGFVRAAKNSEHSLDLLKRDVLDSVLFDKKIEPVTAWLLCGTAELLSGVGDAVEECCDKATVLKLMRQE